MMVTGLVPLIIVLVPLATVLQRNREIEKDLTPRFKDRPISKITRLELTTALKEVEARAPEVARNLRNYLWGIFEYAIDSGLIADNPVPPVRVLRKRNQENHPALSPDLLGEFLRKLDAIDTIHELNLALDRAFEQAPILLTPMCGGQTPSLGRPGTIDGEEAESWVSFSYGFNLTRNPAGTVRCGFTGDGMPVGLQVVGRQLADVAVIQTISALQEVYGTERFAPI